MTKVNSALADPANLWISRISRLRLHTRPPDANSKIQKRAGGFQTQKNAMSGEKRVGVFGHTYA
jgi:hypothetical protein